MKKIISLILLIFLFFTVNGQSKLDSVSLGSRISYALFNTEYSNTVLYKKEVTVFFLFKFYKEKELGKVSLFSMNV